MDISRVTTSCGTLDCDKPPTSTLDKLEESDLYIFEGMEGFENFNPADDSSLVAILDDLQEGTLLSFLEDESFLSEFGNDNLGLNLASAADVDNQVLLRNDDFESLPECEKEFQHSVFSNDYVGLCQEQNENFEEGQSSIEEIAPVTFCDDKLVENESGSNGLEFASNKRPQESSDCFSKRVKVDVAVTTDSNRTASSSVCVQDLFHTLACVHHDHCYTNLVKKEEGIGSDLGDLSTSECQKSPLATASDGEGSIEEGNSSDTGYETMSSSMSPGNTNESPTSPPSSTTVLPTLGGHVDPVALIDARIKHFMCSREVNLTEEENETLKAEGLPIPTTLPLTKLEEKALRNVRRKIRNKVAAQESRKRKKEHIQTLEEKVAEFSKENISLRKSVGSLESENKSLLTQLKKLQALVATNASAAQSNHTTRVGACLMVIVFCFAIFLGGITPDKLWNSQQQQSDYITTSVRSRSLLSVDPTKNNFHSMACDWFKHIFMREQELEDEENYMHPLSKTGLPWDILNLTSDQTIQSDDGCKNGTVSCNASRSRVQTVYSISASNGTHRTSNL